MGRITPKKICNYFSSKLFYSKLPKDWLSDKSYLKWAYFVKIGRRLNLRNPKSFTEKVQWLKLYDRRPEYTTMVDKHAVKQYVAQKIGEEYVIPTLAGPWKSFDEIDFDALPEQFVLKTTHDSGGIAICKDKATFDKAAAKKKLEEHLANRHWKKWREWAYKDVVPQIIAEKYPEYSFDVHKGYGTKAHYVALAEHGPCQIHRMSFLKKFYGEK